MKFHKVPTDTAVNMILAHSFKGRAGTIRKGTFLTHSDIENLKQSGQKHVTVAQLFDDDIHEDEAAKRVAHWATAPFIEQGEPFTGRSNLFARKAGILRVNREIVDALNAVDPRITIASLPDYEPVEAGRMIATAKIIPFAVPDCQLEAALSVSHASPLEIKPFNRTKVTLISTRLSHLKEATMDKTRHVLEERLGFANAALHNEIRVDHSIEALSVGIKRACEDNPELIILFGASAVVDEDDVLPASIKLAGGTVDRVGMPVDPGNLLILASIKGIPVLGAPGCARSPKQNGFDWLLYRMLADVPVTSKDISQMGVGGLLMEIVSRPQPRSGGIDAKEGPVDIIVLAAGRSSRMGDHNKLLATFNDLPLVRKSVQAALSSKARSVTVVVGHMADEIKSALDGLNVEFVHNANFKEGLSTSLKAGLQSLRRDCAGAIIQLADMPEVGAAALDALIDGFDPQNGRLIGVAMSNGKRGNPVLLPNRFFPQAMNAMGDQGAREIIASNPDAVYAVELGDAAVIDVDTKEALEAAGGKIPPPGK